MHFPRFHSLSRWTFKRLHLPRKLDPHHLRWQLLKEGQVPDFLWRLSLGMVGAEAVPGKVLRVNRVYGEMAA